MTFLLLSGSPLRDIRAEEYAVGAIRASVAIAVAVVVYRLVRLVPWPRPFRVRFAALHVAGAVLAALTWYAVSTPLEKILAEGGSDVWGSDRLGQFLFIGILMYAIIVGVSYAADGAARAARAEAMAASTQLAALRSQLHPHFLFNALHTVVQLIPIDPQRAAEAAELVADLLRTAMGEQRDEVTVSEEWRFVSRYLEMERIRFGDRLIVRSDLPDTVLGDRVPSFALQTLVENAVRHGAAPRVAPTEIAITGTRSPDKLSLSVRNTSNGQASQPGASGTGTGLSRLRERLTALYGDAASVVSQPGSDGVYEAVLSIPISKDRAR